MATRPFTTPWLRLGAALQHALCAGGMDRATFGSVDGDMPAAMRYTECRLMKVAGRDARGYRSGDGRLRPPIMDESTFEPSVLPARAFPNLIVNGANGIAVGMATNIPPHNLTEVINAAIEMINNPHAGTGRSAEARTWARLPDRRFSLRTQRH